MWVFVLIVLLNGNVEMRHRIEVRTELTCNQIRAEVVQGARSLMTAPGVQIIATECGAAI